MVSPRPATFLVSPWSLASRRRAMAVVGSPSGTPPQAAARPASATASQPIRISVGPRERGGARPALEHVEPGAVGEAAHVVLDLLRQVQVADLARVRDGQLFDPRGGRGAHGERRVLRLAA